MQVLGRQTEVRWVLPSRVGKVQEMGAPSPLGISGLGDLRWWAPATTEEAKKGRETAKSCPFLLPRANPAQDFLCVLISQNTTVPFLHLFWTFIWSFMTLLWICCLCYLYLLLKDLKNVTCHYHFSSLVKLRSASPAEPSKPLAFLFTWPNNNEINH